MRILAYLKPSNYCAVGCSHCYLPESLRANRSRMPLEIVKQTAEMLHGASRQKPGEVHIIWHGGEPLSVPQIWYRDAGRVLDEILPGHTESIQTSLIPYQSAFAKFVHERCESQIGSSVDFSQRMLKGDVTKYQERWLKKVDQARKDGLTITPTMVPTINEIGAEEKIVDWFLEHGFLRFNIERYNAFGRQAPFDCPSNTQHSRFMTSLFNTLMERVQQGRPFPAVGAVQAAIRGVLFGFPGDRWGGSCQANSFVIEPGGEINNCPDKAGVEAPFAQVSDGPEQISAAPMRRTWMRIQSIGHKNERCGECPYLSWCGTGCPINDNSLQNGDDCSGYAQFLQDVTRFCNENAHTAKNYLNECSAPMSTGADVGSS